MTTATGRPNWFTGEAWAASKPWLEAMAARVAAGGIGHDLPTPAGPYIRAGDIAVITIDGALLEAPDYWDRCFGASALGYSGVRQAVRAASADPHVTRVVLRINSPGGTVAGCQETAEAIAGCTKPVEAHVTMACSAGYWLAAAADRIVAAPSAVIGCLGVQVMVRSDAKADELGGFWANPWVQITSDETPGKNADPLGGGPGAGQYQNQVNDLWTLFRDAIAGFRDADRTGGRHRKGRGDPSTIARDFTIGEAVIAGRALAAGMIDEIRNLDSGGGTPQGATAALNPTEGATMPEPNESPTPEGGAVDAVKKAEAEAQAIRQKAEAEAQAIRQKAEAEAKVAAEAAYKDRREAAVSRTLAERKIKPYERESASAAYDLEHRFADAADATGHKPWTAIVNRKPDTTLPSTPEGSGGEGVRENDAGVLAQFNDWAKANVAQSQGDLKVAVGAFERHAGPGAASKVAQALFGEAFDAIGGAR